MVHIHQHANSSVFIPSSTTKRATQRQPRRSLTKPFPPTMRRESKFRCSDAPWGSLTDLALQSPAAAGRTVRHSDGPRESSLSPPEQAQDPVVSRPDVQDRGSITTEMQLVSTDNVEYVDERHRHDLFPVETQDGDATGSPGSIFDKDLSKDVELETFFGITQSSVEQKEAYNVPQADMVDDSSPEYSMNLSLVEETSQDEHLNSAVGFTQSSILERQNCNTSQSNRWKGDGTKANFPILRNDARNDYVLRKAIPAPNFDKDPNEKVTVLRIRKERLSPFSNYLTPRSSTPFVPSPHTDNSLVSASASPGPQDTLERSRRSGTVSGYRPNYIEPDEMSNDGREYQEIADRVAREQNFSDSDYYEDPQSTESTRVTTEEPQMAQEADDSDDDVIHVSRNKRSDIPLPSPSTPSPKKRTQFRLRCYSVLSDHAQMARDNILRRLRDKSHFGIKCSEAIPKEMWPKRSRNTRRPEDGLNRPPEARPKDWPTSLLENIARLAMISPTEPQDCADALWRAIAMRRVEKPNTPNCLYYAEDVIDAQVLLRQERARAKIEGDGLASPVETSREEASLADGDDIDIMCRTPEESVTMSPARRDSALSEEIMDIGTPFVALQEEDVTKIGQGSHTTSTIASNNRFTNDNCHPRRNLAGLSDDAFGTLYLRLDQERTRRRRGGAARLGRSIELGLESLTEEDIMSLQWQEFVGLMRAVDREQERRIEDYYEKRIWGV